MKFVARGVRLLALSVASALLMVAFVATGMQDHHIAGVLGTTVVHSNAQDRRRETNPSPPLTAEAASVPVAAPAPEQWDSIGRAVPHVVSFEPSTNPAPVNGAIVFTFSQPMAAGSVERSFAIRPAVHGRWYWSDTLTFVFRPFKLAHGVAYEVQVNGRSARGAPLRGQLLWRFTTALGPQLVVAAGQRSVKVPILMYHYIRTNPDPRDTLGFALSVTPANFAAQMDWLASNGFHPITTSDLFAYLSGAQGLPSRPVILTFDDGYADFYDTALPILRAHDFTAVAYVVSGFIGRPGYMTADQVSEADLSGIEIGSHTVDHVNLEKSNYGSLRFEVAQSKQALEQLLGHSVLSFCYPSGRFNSAVVAAVQAAGYQDATTTAFGYFHAMSDRYVWSRLRISGSQTLSDFATALTRAS